MRPSRVAEVLRSVLEGRWPAFLWGPPGAGKSSIVRQVAEESGMKLVDVRAPLLDPTDLRGIPTVDHGVARWCPPSFLPSEPEPGILFFDELNAAPQLVQASLYQLTLDRRVGEYVLPDGWRILAAGNRAEDRSVTFRMPSALANRFVHIDFEVDFEDWRRWAVGRGIHPLVIAFLGVSPSSLFDMTNPGRAFPTPRSWEMVSDLIAAFGAPEKAEDLLVGTVGEGAAVAFLNFRRSSITEERIRAIVGDPEHAPMPGVLGDLYAIVTYLAVHARDRRFRDAAGRLLHRLPAELGVLLLRDVLRLEPSFLTHPGARAFVQRHGEALA